MSDLRTAAQQALEALEQIAVLAEYGTTGPGKCHSRALNEQQATALRLSVSDLSRSQITALKEALVEAAMQKFTDVNQELEAALAEPVEPVASLMTHLQSGDMEVAWNDDGFDRELWHEAPLYTAPPQRKPLSEEEIKRIDDSTHFHESPDWSLRFARAVERAHGIT